nr:polysaccharide pyruvyl transferase family protein [Enterococcus xiangfangensis]
MTFHEVWNYGAVLQNFALQKVVEQIISKEDTIETIDLPKSYFAGKTQLFNFEKHDFLRSLAQNIYLYPYKKNKQKAFNGFKKNEMNFSRRIFQVEDILKYDGFIVGSDQVWNPEITGFDESFFLNFSEKNSKKIAYAASIGKDILTEKERMFLKNNISNFNNISVREKSAKDILSEMGYTDVVKVLDPTLLLQKKEWEKLDNNKFQGKKFILVYTLEKNDLINFVVRYLQEKFKLEVIYLTPNNKKDFFGSKNSFGPYDFISAFKNAQYVITNSFHGTAFAINFEKNFITIPHKTRGTRMKSLLEDLNLNSRIYENSFEDVPCEKINYTDVMTRLNFFREESLDFLKKSLL